MNFQRWHLSITLSFLIVMHQNRSHKRLIFLPPSGTSWISLGQKLHKRMDAGAEIFRNTQLLKEIDDSSFTYGSLKKFLLHSAPQGKFPASTPAWWGHVWLSLFPGKSVNYFPRKSRTTTFGCYRHPMEKSITICPCNFHNFLPWTMDSHPPPRSEGIRHPREKRVFHGFIRTCRVIFRVSLPWAPSIEAQSFN